MKSLLNTKMLYPHDSRKHREVTTKATTLIVIVAVSVLVLLVAPVRNVLTQGVYLIAPQMWAAGSMVSEKWSSVISNFHDKAALSSENVALRAEINRMQAEVLDRNLLAERVASLEGSLGRVKSDDRVVASVMVDSKNSPYDVLVVDAGADNGVAVGNKVVLADSGVIGEVIEVSAGSAKISLYSSPGVDTPAVVGVHSTPIVASGRGMGNYEAKVPESSPVNVGDEVHSVKGNLILGMVSSVERKPAEPFVRIFFRAPFNITEIRSVEIIIDKRS